MNIARHWHGLVGATARWYVRTGKSGAAGPQPATPRLAGCRHQRMQPEPEAPSHCQWQLSLRLRDSTTLARSGLTLQQHWQGQGAPVLTGAHVPAQAGWPGDSYLPWYTQSYTYPGYPRHLPVPIIHNQKSFSFQAVGVDCTGYRLSRGVWRSQPDRFYAFGVEMYFEWMQGLGWGLGRPG